MIMTRRDEGFRICLLVGRSANAVVHMHPGSYAGRAGDEGKGGIDPYLVRLPDRRHAWNFEKS